MSIIIVAEMLHTTRLIMSLINPPIPVWPRVPTRLLEIIMIENQPTIHAFDSAHVKTSN